jgi:hypothetical protein
MLYIVTPYYFERTALNLVLHCRAGKLSVFDPCLISLLYTLRDFQFVNARVLADCLHLRLSDDAEQTVCWLRDYLMILMPLPR